MYDKWPVVVDLAHVYNTIITYDMHLQNFSYLLPSNGLSTIVY